MATKSRIGATGMKTSTWLADTFWFTARSTSNSKDNTQFATQLCQQCTLSFWGSATKPVHKPRPEIQFNSTVKQFKAQMRQTLSIWQQRTTIQSMVLWRNWISSKNRKLLKMVCGLLRVQWASVFLLTQMATTLCSRVAPVSWSSWTLSRLC